MIAKHVDSRNGRKGFTLVELLIVVALIAIVSGLVVGLYNGAVKDSAETTSIATQKQLTNSVNNFFQLHNGKLADGFDSLLRDQVARPFGGTYTAVSTGGLAVADNPKDAIYVGYDVADNTTLAAPYDNIADPTAQSKGIDTAAYLGVFRSITIAQLTSSDLATLNQLGIYTVNDVSVGGDCFHGDVTYVKRTLKVGDPVCILDPRTARNGISIYSDFGVDLSDANTYTRATAATAGDYAVSVNDLDDTGRNKAIAKQRFLVFGIGPACKMIGDRKGGLQDAPTSSIVVDGAYNKFFLVIKMPGGPNDMSPAIAGVLDPRGCAVRGARGWASRTE